MEDNLKFKEMTWRYFQRHKMSKISSQKDFKKFQK